MQRYINNVAIKNGAKQLSPLVGGLVTVTTIDGSAAEIFEANGGLPMTAPLLTDIRGAFAFYAADGRYTITITGPTITPITITDVLLEDQAVALDTLPVGLTVGAALASPAAEYADIPEIESDNVDLAGASGPLNAQAVALAKRTENLKDATDSLQLESYAALRAYNGARKNAYVTGYLSLSTPAGIAGTFVRDDADTTSADNAGTIIVAANGKRWKRSFDGTVNVQWFGADKTGAASSSAAIAAAQAYLLTLGGGTLYFPPGEYKVTTPIVMAPGVTYLGAMRAGLSAFNTGRSRLFSSTGNLFNNSGSLIAEACFRDLYIESEAGGGHIFDWSSAGIVAKIEMSGVCLAQRNKAKCVILGHAAGGVFSIWLHDFEYVYVPDCSFPPIWFATTTVNSIAIENFWSTANGQSAAGNPSIWVESTNPGGHAFNIGIKQGVFELPGSGSVRLLSCTNSVIEQCAVYDLSITPGYYQFSVDKGPTGPASTNVTIRDCRSTVGTVALADVFLNMSVAGQGGFQIEGSTFAVVDGQTAGGAYVGIKNSAVTTLQNLNYIDMNAGPEANLTFGSTTATGAVVSLWNGYSGNRDGALNFKINGTHSGSMSKTGVFSWGNAYTTQAGTFNAGGQVYPGTPAGAQQIDCGQLAGTGVPNNAQGNNGDVYFNGAGASMTTMYQKRAGVWVALL